MNFEFQPVRRLVYWVCFLMKSAVSIQGDEANISQEAGYGALLVIVGFKDAVEICRLNDLV